MELFIFARFHAREDQEAAVAEVLGEVLGPTRAEPGCRSAEAYRSVRDPRLFFIHSHWRDEAAFETHATLAHTKRFLERVQLLIDHPLDINRTTRLRTVGKARRLGVVDGAFTVSDDLDTTMRAEIEEMFHGTDDSP